MKIDFHKLEREELIRLMELPNHLRETMLALMGSPSKQADQEPPRVTT